VAGELVVYKSYQQQQQEFAALLSQKRYELSEVITTLGERNECKIRSWWFFGPRYAFDYGHVELRFDFDEDYDRAAVYEMRVKGVKGKAKRKSRVDLAGQFDTPQIFTDRIKAFRIAKKYGCETREEALSNEMDQALQIVRDYVDVYRDDE
jgi:hypothetical protein